MVPNNPWILELQRLPVEAPFSPIETSVQSVICYHQHHGVICILNSMNMGVLTINYPTMSSA